MKTDNVQVTEGQTVILLYDMWIEMLGNGEILDCKRFSEDFFASYGKEIQSEKAPFYLMFCAFVGGMDMIGKLGELDVRSSEKQA